MNAHTELHDKVGSPTSEIVIRNIPFKFNDENFDPIWNKREPEFSQMVNAGSLSLPYLEPFLIRTIREEMDHVDDPALKKDMHAFNAQEAQHFNPAYS